MSIAFSIPDFLKGQSVGEIQQKMLGNLPADIDKSEGQYPWDFCISTAIEKSEMVQFQLTETLRLLFPQFAYGIWLDLHGEIRGLPRNPATYAEGYLDITGIPDTAIPAGFAFATMATPEAPNIEFSTTAEYTIPPTGTLAVAVKATISGIGGNVAANTITLMVNPLEGITSVTNPAEMDGGTSEETDENYRARILRYDDTQGLSFVGNIADYERWSTEGTGVKSVSIIPPVNDSGVIQIVLLETTEGDPIPSNDPEPYRTRVYNKIMAPNNPIERLAPINANINVVGSTAINISVQASIEIDNTRTLAQITNDFVAAMQTYFTTAIAQGELKYSVVGSLLTITAGVYDYQNLLIKKAGGTFGINNIPVAQYETLTIGAESVVFTVI